MDKHLREDSNLQKESISESDVEVARGIGSRRLKRLSKPQNKNPSESQFEIEYSEEEGNKF